MTANEFVRKIFLIDLLKGLKITGLFLPAPKVTMQYPKERWTPPERFRGMLRMEKNLCTACDLCAKECPESIISITGAKGEDKKKRPVTFTIDLKRCTFCGFCAEVCPTEALTVSKDYELSMYNIEDVFLDMEKLGKGVEITPYEK